jgi:lysophospholipase L1-like esterase
MRAFLVSMASTLALGCGGGAAEPELPAPPPPGSVLAAQPAAPEATSAPEAVVAPEPAQQTPPAELARGLVVLVVGDSFAQALGVGLKAREADLGIKVVMRGKQATYIPEWAGPNFGLDRMVAQTSPDLVVIALGGNELAMTTPEIRRPKVAQLVKLLGDRPCVWASPPLWGNKDNGLLDVIRTESKPCRYYDTSKLVADVPRGSDKIHPSAEGQKVWANALLDWLRSEQTQAEGTAPAPFALRPRPDSE